MSEPGRLYELTWSGKPTGNFVVRRLDGSEVVFRRRVGERKTAVKARAQAWLDEGCVGTPGAVPRGLRRLS